EVSDVVQRLSVPSDVSIEYASPCDLTDPSENPSSRLPGRQRSWVTRPFGTPGNGRGFNVVRSISSSSVYAPLSATAAMRVPSGEISKPAVAAALARSMIIPGGETADQTQLATSQRQIRKSPPWRSLTA